MPLYSTTLLVLRVEGQVLVVRELRSASTASLNGQEPTLEYRVSPDQKLFGLRYDELGSRLGAEPFRVDVVV